MGMKGNKPCQERERKGRLKWFRRRGSFANHNSQPSSPPLWVRVGELLPSTQLPRASHLSPSFSSFSPFSHNLHQLVLFVFSASFSK